MRGTCFIKGKILDSLNHGEADNSSFFILHSSLLWYTVSIAMQYCWYTYAILLVPGRYTFLVPFFHFVYRQYQGESSDEMQQDSSMRVWGWCEGRKFTLTLTLTTETPINRAFQTESEGVRVKKEKKVFFILEGDKKTKWQGEMIRKIRDISIQE